MKTTLQIVLLLTTYAFGQTQMHCYSPNGNSTIRVCEFSGGRVNESTNYGDGDSFSTWYTRAEWLAKLRKAAKLIKTQEGCEGYSPDLVWRDGSCRVRN